jgi:hypothetical protein
VKGSRLERLLPFFVVCIKSIKNADWHEEEKLVLVPHPDLSESQCRIIEQEWGMTNGKREISLRRAFVYPFRKRYALLSEFGSLPAQLRPIIIQSAN